MSRSLGYLVVEGPHDVELCCALLSPKRMTRVRMKSDLAPRLHCLVPPTFPHKGDLQKRVPVPLFLQNDDWAIAIHSAEGETALANTLEETLSMIQVSDWKGIGILLDADQASTPSQRFNALISEISNKSLTLTTPSTPGAVGAGSPKFGVYVLPDNENAGTLEDVLLESAAIQYPDLLPLARQYVADAEAKGQLDKAHLKHLRKPAGRNKATVASMGCAVFRPGKAIQTSIQDNLWLKGEALQIPRIKAVQDFLYTLFG